MIVFDNVTFKYKNSVEILKNFSLKIEEKEHICFFGPSGVGKSTVLRLIAGLEKPTKGSVICEKNNFSAVFQDDRLIPFKTAKENVALFSDDAAAEEVLTQLGLAQSKDKLPKELSGGMKRRVALARALAHKSDILMLDEAFTGLDAEIKDICFNAVEKFLNDRTLICVTHDIKEAEFFNCKIINIKNIVKL